MLDGKGNEAAAAGGRDPDPACERDTHSGGGRGVMLVI